MVKLRSIRGVRPVLIAEQGLICFEHGLLTQSRHQNLLAVSGDIVDTCRNQRQGRNGQVRLKIRSPPSRGKMWENRSHGLRRLTQVHEITATEIIPGAMSPKSIASTPQATRKVQRPPGLTYEHAPTVEASMPRVVFHLEKVRNSAPETDAGTAEPMTLNTQHFREVVSHQKQNLYFSGDADTEQGAARKELVE